MGSNLECRIYFGQLYNLISSIGGIDIITGKELSGANRWLGALGALYMFRYLKQEKSSNEEIALFYKILNSKS